MAQPWSVPFARLDGAALFLCPIGPASPLTESLLAAWLLPEEAARAASHRAPADRGRAARSRAFLRAVLGARLGVNPAEVRLATTARGKPHLVGPGPCFNTSRALDRVVVVLSDSRAVGVDIEDAARLPNDIAAFADLVDACCRAEETDAVLRAPDPRTAFLRLWTAKEARMKLTGEGLTLSPTDITVSFTADRITGFVQPRDPAADLTLIDDLLPDAAIAVASGPAAAHLLA